ncbi:MAG TPA: DUF485 domain-containing protein [Thermoanaerobaculia bacterium]|jgi:uncharacterized membrane protein (DUF485 family)|nr:DUF485 domain-containing protein [Thermoanaerobaculia bacterium]
MSDAGGVDVRRVLDSPDFRRLVTRRWTISLLLTAALFVAYYGFILLVALDKELLARKIGAVTTLGIPIAVAVIVVAWVLTALYVAWANRAYDRAVDELKKELGS